MKFSLFNRSKTTPEQKSDLPMGVVSLSGGGRPLWSSRSAGSLMRTGYLNNPVAFRAVRMIAEAAAHIRLHLQDEKLRYETHPVLALLARPNDGQSGGAFFETLYGHYLLSGQAYIEAKFDDDGQVNALYLLRPDRVRVRPGRDGWPEAYEYVVGNHKTIYALQNGFPPVLQIKSFHPQDDHYGLSPMMAAAGAVDVHNSASTWSKSLLDNAARPSGAIVYNGVDGRGHLGSSQVKRLLDEMEGHFQGASNAGRPMLLEGGLDWKPMGFSPSDMEFHRTKDMASREIALAFGVPPMLLGIPGDNTYSNYQEANRAFYRLTILPLVERIVSALNGWLLLDENANLKLDPDAIPALATERESDWRRVGSANFLTMNEKRKLLGFPAIEGDEDAERI